MAHGASSAASSSGSGGWGKVVFILAILFFAFITIRWLWITGTGLAGFHSGPTVTMHTPGATRPDGSIFYGPFTIYPEGTSIRGLEGHCLHGGRNKDKIRNLNKEARDSRFEFFFETKGDEPVDVDFILYPAGHKKCSYL